MTVGSNPHIYFPLRAGILLMPSECGGCLGLRAYTDQLESEIGVLRAELRDLQTREREWRTEAVQATVNLMEHRGEVERLPDGRYALTEYGRSLSA